MTYAIDLRKRVINFIENGHSIKETGRVFQIGTTTISKWIKLKRETCSLRPKELKRKPRKLDYDKLVEFVKNNSDMYIKDIANYFKVSRSGILYAFKILKITRKKKSKYIKKEMKKRGKNL